MLLLRLRSRRLRVDSPLALPFLLLVALVLAGLSSDGLAQEPDADPAADPAAEEQPGATRSTDEPEAEWEEDWEYEPSFGDYHLREFQFVRVYDQYGTLCFKIDVEDPNTPIAVMFDGVTDARAEVRSDGITYYVDSNGREWAAFDGNEYALLDPAGDLFYAFHKDDPGGFGEYDGGAAYGYDDLFSGGLGVILIILILGFYVVPAVCIGIIAHKIGIENAWLWGLIAIIGPIGQAYAIAHMSDGEIKYAHMVLIGSFIPFIGPFLVIYGMIMLYISLCQVCGQPSWHCILCLFFSTFYFIYLAVLPQQKALSNREMRARGMLPPSGPGMHPGAPPYPGAPGWNPAMAGGPGPGAPGWNPAMAGGPGPGAPGWNPAMAGAGAMPGQFAPHGYAPPPSNPNDGWESIDDDPDFAPDPSGKPAHMAQHPIDNDPDFAPIHAGGKPDAMAHPGGMAGAPMQRSGAPSGAPQRRPGPGGPGPRPGQRPGPGPRGQMPPGARPQGQPRPGSPQGQPRPGGPQGQPRPGGPQGQPRPGQPRPGQPRPGGPQGQRPPGAPGQRPPGARPQQRPPQGGPRPPGTPGM